MIKKIVLAAMLAASIGSISAPATSAERYAREAPPPPRTETVPAARRGWVWAPGHWEWRGRRYHWVKGTWLRERRGYRYAEHQWVERDGKWYREGGNWRRGDRDGDGVPNRMDRAPNNPNRQ
jgi:hypothetical protein